MSAEAQALEDMAASLGAAVAAFMAAPEQDQDAAMKALRSASRRLNRALRDARFDHALTGEMCHRLDATVDEAHSLLVQWGLRNITLGEAGIMFAPQERGSPPT